MKYPKKTYKRFIYRFTNTTSGKMAADCICSTISTVIGDADLSVKSIKKISLSHPAEAAVLGRLNNLGSMQVVGSRSTTKRRVQMCANTVKARIFDIAQSTIEEKAFFLENAPYPSFIIDEGLTWSKTMPLYVATCVCTSSFKWKTMFIGQEDSSGRKDGESIHKLTKKIFVDNRMQAIYKRLICGCTDGASVMRSIRLYAGLDANGTDGTSFAAYMKKDVNEDVEMWHCLCHMLNLGVNDALECIPALKLFYLPHVRMMHSEFSRSSLKRETLKEVLEHFKQLHGLTHWKIFYPKLFCLTRWLGLHACAETLAKNREVFGGYADVLREDGFGPRAFKPKKKKKKSESDTDSDDADSDADDDDDDDDSDDDSDDEEDGGESIDEEQEREEEIEDMTDEAREMEYQTEVTAFASAREAADSAPSQEELVRADGMDTGATGRLPKTRRKNLLNKDVGLNDLNMGRSAYLEGALRPYTVLVQQLQTSSRPTQHMAARHIRSYYRQMVTHWIGTAKDPPTMSAKLFQDWKKCMLEKGKDELVELVTAECKAFCGVMVKAHKARLEPYWNSIQALELIDPSGPGKYATEEVWQAAEDICSRRDIDSTHLRTVVNARRAEYPDLNPVDREQIQADLLQYYRRKHETRVLHGATGDGDGDNGATRCLHEYATAVFSIPIVSAFVESLFSKMNYNQNKSRNRLLDETTTAILHVHDTVVPNPLLPLDGTFPLRCNKDNDTLTKRKHMKNLGRVVCGMFVADGRTDGLTERFHGKVTKIEYDEDYAEWMYHVVYPAFEGHQEDHVDYFRDEIEPLWCTCEKVVQQSVRV